MKMTKIFMALCGLMLLLCAKQDDEMVWDNPVDPNGTIPQPTVTTMEDTTVPINDTVILHAKGNSKLGRIIRYYWTFDQGLTWEIVNDSTGIIKKPFSASTGAHVIVQVKVADTIGRYSRVSKPDSFSVFVRLLPPVVVPVNDTVVSRMDTVRIHVIASDSSKTRIIQKYYWDKNADGWDDSTDTPYYDFTYPQGGPLKVIWGARDDDGNFTMDTFGIRFNRAPESLHMSKPANGDTASYLTFDKTTGKGSVVLCYSAVDSDGLSDTLRYTLYFKKGQSLDSVFGGTDTTFTIDSLDTSKVYSWKLHVRDSLGDSMVATGTFRTPSVDLTPPKITIKGNNPTKIPLCSQYKDSGATALDNVDGNISNKIKVSGLDSVNTWVADTYVVTYTVEDSMQNVAVAKRNVIVESYIIFEDFETGPENQTMFGALFGAVNNDSIGCWTARTDKEIGLNTSFNPDPYTDPAAPFKNVVLDGKGYNNTRGLAILVESDNTGDTTMYWNLGFYLKSKSVYYNLSGIDSITFYVKGDDVPVTIRVQFTNPHIDSLPLKERWGYVGKELPNINENWQKIILKPSELKGIQGSPGNGLTWDSVKNKIRMMQFVNSHGIFYPQALAFDDIKIYGDFKNSGLIP